MTVESTNHEYVVQSVKAAPAVAGSIFSYVTLNEAVAIATLIYVVLQIILLVRNTIIAHEDRKEMRTRKTDRQDGS